jgi:hypothetical protein
MHGMSMKEATSINFLKLSCCYNEDNTGTQAQECNLTQVFTEEEKFPLNMQEIEDAQKADAKLKHCFKHNVVIDSGLEVSLFDGAYGVCREGRMVIPMPLQRHKVLGYQHYPQ